MKSAILSIVQFINDFVYIYPLFMSFAWIFGAILFFIRRERSNQYAPKLDSYPLCSIIIPCHNEEDNIKKQ